MSDAPENHGNDRADKRTTNSIIPLVYDQLRLLAARKLASESPGQTLSATALVHEAYLLLAKSDEPQWDTRGHFYVAAAESMRRILISRARRRNAVKRGSGVKPVQLAEDSINAPMAPTRDDELLALDEALTRLEAEDERKARLVTLRYFVGLTIEEAAEVLEISLATAKRDWTFARAWLQRELMGEGGE